MALVPKDKQHELQIEAGVEGRLKGHRFEEVLTDQLNKIEVCNVDTLVTLKNPNIYVGNPAAALVEYISNDKNKTITRVKSYWLGGLATAGQGAELKNDAGEVITGSKSDIVMDVNYSDGSSETLGVSVKSCKNNAQVALTTSAAFCDMLRKNGIDVSEDAEIGLKMFCGESGYSPADEYVPDDNSNIPSPRNARPERWFWEEIPTRAQQEWEQIFTVYQDKITTLILQKANAYKTDIYPPTYILHECNEHKDINKCCVCVVSMKEMAEYSRLFDGFGLKGKPISKGSYKGIDLAIHMYPHVGFLQFQPIGNKQNFSELQFNLKSNYYKTFIELKKKGNESS